MKTYPVNLLVEDRNCLIIGGGKVATRKFKSLREQGAAITVVAPEISEKIKSYRDFTGIRICERNFEEMDLDNTFLVYIATDDRAFNETVLALCKEREILTCCVDKNWKKSDFITPATLNFNDLTISVSSNGAQCRRTRTLKEVIAKQLALIEDVDLTVLGTDHNYLSLADREPFHLTGDKFQNVGKRISLLNGIQEFILLNTCNRIEVIALARKDEDLIDMMKTAIGFQPLENDQMYIKTGYEALHHICMTTSGLYSQTPGENHIVAQFKDALKVATENHWAGGACRELGDLVLHIQKRIRTEYAHLYRIDEIEELSMKYAESQFQSLKEKKVVVIGTGKLGKSAVEKLSKGCDITWIYRNSVPENIPDDVQLLPLKKMEDALTKADLAIFAVSSPEAIITDHFLNSRALNGTPIFIDLGMPRNISVQEQKNHDKVHVVNLEHLKQWYWKERSDLKELSISAEQKINDHKERYDEFIRSIKNRNP